MVAVNLDEDGHGAGLLPEDIGKDYNAKKAIVAEKKLKELLEDAHNAIFRLKSSPLPKILSLGPLGAGQYDVQNISPKSHLIWHHSVGPESDEHRHWTDRQWKDWFNTVGRARTYAGYAHSFHYEADGRETFSAVPLLLVPNGDGDSLSTDTWRIIIVSDWKSQVFWHCGNWEMNRRAVGVETYGRYDNKSLPDNATRALARWVKDNLEPQNGNTTIILGHREVTSTACPGSILPGDRDKLVDMTNNPQNYNNIQQKVWNKPEPVKPGYETNFKAITDEVYMTTSQADLVNFQNGAIIKSFSAGTDIQIKGQTKLDDGREFYMSAYSVDNRQWQGIETNRMVRKTQSDSDQEMKEENEKLKRENQKLRLQVDSAVKEIASVGEENRKRIKELTEEFKKVQLSQELTFSAQMRERDQKIMDLEKQNEELNKNIFAKFSVGFMELWKKLPYWFTYNVDKGLGFLAFYAAYQNGNDTLFNMGSFVVTWGVVLSALKMLGYQYKKELIRQLGKSPNSLELQRKLAR